MGAREALRRTGASMKSYFKNGEASFCSRVMPLRMMVIFGWLECDRFEGAEIGIVDQAENEASAAVIERLTGRADELLDVEVGTLSREMERLEEGRIDALFVIPAGFGEDGVRSVVQATTDERSPQRAALGVTLVGQALSAVAIAR